jgi:hypothetical protein
MRKFFFRCLLVGSEAERVEKIRYEAEQNETYDEKVFRTILSFFYHFTVHFFTPRFA